MENSEKDVTDIMKDVLGAEREYKDNWRDISFEMPYFEFPQGWKVSITPPFTGAAARFRIRSGNAEVSVYFDIGNRLGFYTDENMKAKPYWEVYPFPYEDEGEIAEDGKRFDMDDTKGIISAIQKSIDYQNSL